MMQKLVLGLSLAQILPEEINKIISPNNPGFIDVMTIQQHRHQILVVVFVISTKYSKAIEVFGQQNLVAKLGLNKNLQK